MSILNVVTRLENLVVTTFLCFLNSSPDFPLNISLVLFIGRFIKFLPSFLGIVDIFSFDISFVVIPILSVVICLSLGFIGDAIVFPLFFSNNSLSSKLSSISAQIERTIKKIKNI